MPRWGPAGGGLYVPPRESHPPQIRVQITQRFTLVYWGPGQARDFPCTSSNACGAGLGLG